MKLKGIVVVEIILMNAFYMSLAKLVYPTIHRLKLLFLETLKRKKPQSIQEIYALDYLFFLKKVAFLASFKGVVHLFMKLGFEKTHVLSGLAFQSEHPRRLNNYFVRKCFLQVLI